MVHPWEAPDPEAKRLSTVDQADIRGLPLPMAGAEPHDLDSSGAASIYQRAWHPKGVAHSKTRGFSLPLLRFQDRDFPGA